MNDTLSTRERILETATNLFSQKGFHAVSTTDIARAAGVNKALIFYYYSSKEELYHTVYRSRIEHFRERLENAFMNVQPGLPMIETFVRNQIAFFTENQAMIRMYIREMLFYTSDTSSAPPPFMKVFAEVLRPIRDRMLAALAYARERGEIRDVDPVQTMVNIISLNIFFFLGKPMINMVSPGVDSEEFQNRRVDHVVDLLMNGLRKQPE